MRTQRRDNSFFRFSSPICAHAHERRRGVWVCAGFWLCVTSTCVGADLLLLLHCFDRGNLRSCLLCAVGASLCVVGHLTRALCLLLCLRNLARGRVLLCGKSVCVVGRRAGESRWCASETGCETRRSGAGDADTGGKMTTGAHSRASPHHHRPTQRRVTVCSAESRESCCGTRRVM